MSNRKLSFTKEEIENVVKSVDSFSQVLKAFNKPKNGYYVKRFKQLIDEHKCDTSHFEKTAMIECNHCGKIFEVMLHDKDKRKFCSLKCGNQKIRGAAIPKNEEDLYGEKKYRLICFRYHEKKCVVCGEANIVGVHHYDENHENNDPKNLVPICPTHHCYLHSNFKNLVSDKVDDYHKKFLGV